MKNIFSAVAIAITFLAYFPYIRSIIQGKTKPHVFSWVIWGMATVVVSLAQLKAHGGAGAWPIGASGVLTLAVAVMAYMRRADVSITRIDWIFFVAALASLPLWYLTADPFWAVAVLTTVDVLGFAPTVRKAYDAPFEEPALFYGLFAARNGVSLLALESYSWTTILFPVVTAVACVLVMAVIARRRTEVLPVPNLKARESHA